MSADGYPKRVESLTEDIALFESVQRRMKSIDAAYLYTTVNGDMVYVIDMSHIGVANQVVLRVGITS